MNRFVVDAQLPPALARYLSAAFGVDAFHVSDLGLRDARDSEIARVVTERNATIITKDHDFVSLARGHRIPSCVLLTCGNVGNARLREIMTANFPRLLVLLESGERVIEVTG